MWELIWGKTLRKTSLTTMAVMSILAVRPVVMVTMGVVVEW